MKRLVLVMALLGGFIDVSLAQQKLSSAPLDRPQSMSAPNYATKYLVPPTRPPSQPDGASAITYNVTFVDPSGPYASYYPSISSALQAAGAAWNHYLIGSGSLEVTIMIEPSIPTADGSSVSSGFVRNDGTRDIFEQGAAYEIRTGTDPNGADPDIRIRIGAAYLTDELWFDPNPVTRTAPVPSNKIDAVSVLIHELGHAFVFSGFMNPTTGQLPATYMSTYDANSNFDGTNFYFNGGGASARYGAPVPLTFGNIAHLANAAPRPGTSLLPDLMNGVVYYHQTRYYISPVDLEVARDCGVVITPIKDQLLNVSTRLGIQTGENVLIGGFIVAGHTPKRIVLRGIGPSLTAFGVANAVADPILELHQPDGSTTSNDNWRSTQQTEIQATGLAPSQDLEAAILAPLAPGSYTAVVRGNNSGVGVALVEGYDLDASLDARLGNISTRGFVTGGDSVMIGGIIAGPSATTSATMLVRAIGPSLGAFGVANPLADPSLELHDANGGLLASNNDWKQTQQMEIEATGIPPTNDRESAILTTFPQGSYTAIVRGNGDGTGVALVEVYDLTPL